MNAVEVDVTGKHIWIHQTNDEGESQEITIHVDQAPLFVEWILEATLEIRQAHKVQGAIEAK